MPAELGDRRLLSFGHQAFCLPRWVFGMTFLPSLLAHALVGQRSENAGFGLEGRVPSQLPLKGRVCDSTPKP